MNMIKQQDVIVDYNITVIIDEIIDNMLNGDYDVVKSNPIKMLVGYHPLTKSNIFIRYLNYEPYQETTIVNNNYANMYIEIDLIIPTNTHGESIKILISVDPEDSEFCNIIFVGNISNRPYINHANKYVYEKFSFKCIDKELSRYDLNIFLSDMCDNFYHQLEKSKGEPVSTHSLYYGLETDLDENF